MYIYIYTPCVYICICIFVCVYIYACIIHRCDTVEDQTYRNSMLKKSLQLLGQYISTIQQIAPCIKGLPVPGKHGQRLQFLEMEEEARAHLSWDMVALADVFA